MKKVIEFKRLGEPEVGYISAVIEPAPEMNPGVDDPGGKETAAVLGATLLLGEVVVAQDQEYYPWDGIADVLKQLGDMLRRYGEGL